MTARSDVGMEPINNEALAGGAAQCFRGVAQSVSHQFNADDLQLKEFAMLRARLEKRGYSLVLSGSGACYVAKWGFIKRLGNMAAVESFARQVGAS